MAIEVTSRMALQRRMASRTAKGIGYPCAMVLSPPNTECFSIEK
jgi:hypothetical protein